MGQELVRTVLANPNAELAGAIERPGSEFVGKDAGILAGSGETGIAITDDPLAAIAAADGVLDFTAPDASVEFAAFAAQARAVHVIGTTGFQNTMKRRSLLQPATPPLSNPAI